MFDFRDIEELATRTRSGRLRVADVADQVLDALELARRPEAWLHKVSPELLRSRAAELDSRRRDAEAMPLFGVPFAVKDNIDVAGVPTTAGCPAFAYLPSHDAFAIDLLRSAGALFVGKTHMDQFATGLVGTRSPQGPCRNALVADRISGGSSSGSAVAVAEGIVSFALGTDTAGSGRVPAVLNGVVGLKPTRGRISASGVVPACASLDCVSIFAASSTDAARVLDVLDIFDPADPYARSDRSWGRRLATRDGSFRFGVPALLPRNFGLEARNLFDAARTALEAIGGTAVEINFSPFLAAAQLLYGGGWTSERDSAFGDFVREHPEAVDPAVASILNGAKASGRGVFESMHELQRLRRAAEPVWNHIDVLAVPTTSEPWKISEVQQRPLAASIEYGATNNFVNLFDLTALALPTGLWASGVPFGITLCAPALSESLLLDLGQRVQDVTTERVLLLERPHRLLLAVVGAHLEGMPLHGQLLDLDARLVAKTQTAPVYRLHALANTSPPKPGLERIGHGGAAIEVEVYALAPDAFGRFVAAVPAPMTIGRIALTDGSEVPGFLCEPRALQGATDITSFGGWRAWCARN